MNQNFQMNNSGNKRKFLSCLSSNPNKLLQKRTLSLIDYNILANQNQIQKNEIQKNIKECKGNLSLLKQTIRIKKPIKNFDEQISKIKETVNETKEYLDKQINNITKRESAFNNRPRTKKTKSRHSFYLSEGEIDEIKPLNKSIVENTIPRKFSLVFLNTKKKIQSTSLSMNQSINVSLNQDNNDKLIPLLKIENFSLNDENNEIKLDKTETEDEPKIEFNEPKIEIAESKMEIIEPKIDINEPKNNSFLSNLTITESSMHQSPIKKEKNFDENILISHVESLNIIQTERQIESLIIKNKQLEESLSLATENYLSIQNSLQELLSELHKSESYRIELHKHIQRLRGSIRVFCRVKPQFDIEARSSLQYPELSLTSSSDKELTIIDLKQQSFHFDKVFTESSTQKEIFEEIRPVLQSALDGDNVCIFAYGATGSGKTFTMQGPIYNSNEITEFSGVLPRSAEFILNEFARKIKIENGKNASIELSACEIYNENVYDLLNNKSQVILGSNGIKGLSSCLIRSQNDIINLCALASKTRRSESTKFNEVSSRSHAVYMIKISIEGQSKINSYINIIDLAGSEKCSISTTFGKTQREIETMKRVQCEAGFINKSLTALGRCISMLADKKSNKTLIPYRDSKLTMILKNSLTVNSKTVIIINVSPDVKDIAQTKESFAFATNALFAF